MLETAISPASQDRLILGQPRGLGTLFFTEMWERFSYYGMRAILILFLVAPVSEGGLGISDKIATSIYGLYVACSYLLSLLGGWIADRLIGAQRAVIGGAVLIMLGNALLASGTIQVFFLGLVVTVCGVGLLKPNISAMVAQLYPEGGSRRDAGFSIFIVGIAVGSLLGSVLVPICVAHFGWHWGFGLPAVGMLLGLVQFMLTRRCLGSAGLKIFGQGSTGSWLPVSLFIIAVASIVSLSITGRLTIDPVAVSAAATWLIAFLAVAYFAYLLVLAGLTAEERRHVYVMVALFVASVIFWTGYEQGGGLLNLFADRYTDRIILGWQMPAGVLQGVTSLTDILFAPVFAALWLALGRRGKDLSAPAKFAVGLMLMSLGFFVMFVASRFVVSGQKVLPTWLVLTYLLEEWGALCLSPVGLSSMTKLAPRRFIGQVMGVWFLSVALGNNLAVRFSDEYDARNLHSLPALFLETCLLSVVGGGGLLLLSPVLKRFMAGVK